MRNAELNKEAMELSQYSFTNLIAQAVSTIFDDAILPLFFCLVEQMIDTFESFIRRITTKPTSDSGTDRNMILSYHW